MLQYEVQYDVFISHASEDKENVVKPLAEALRSLGVQVWLDEIRIEWGDSLSQTIDRGLAQSRYGLVVLSRAFFSKSWTMRELNGLVSRQVDERRVVVLPIWVDVDAEFIRTQSPPLADQKAVCWSDGAGAIASRLKAMLDQDTGSGSSVPTQRPLVGGAEMAGRVSNLLQANQRIAVEELIRTQTQAVLEIVRRSEFDPKANIRNEQEQHKEFRRRVLRYEEAVGELSATLSVVAYHGEPHFEVAVRRSLEQLGDGHNDPPERSSGGYPIWTMLRQYPAILVFHRTACAAIAAERWDNLRPLLVSAKLTRGPVEEALVPMITRVRPCDFARNPWDQWLHSEGLDPNAARYTPTEDHLAERVKDSLSWLGLKPQESERIMDVWLFVGQVAYMGVPSSSGRIGDRFSLGRFWRMRVFGAWDSTPQAGLIERVTREGDASPVLRSGVAEDAIAFIKRSEVARQMIAERASAVI